MRQPWERSARALDILRAEHRSLSAVMRGMLYLIREVRLRRADPRFNVFAAMIEYINAVPERFHHPKEDAYLFRLLTTRWPAARPLVDKLQAEHRLGAAKVSRLGQALEKYRHGGSSEFHEFAAAAAEYAALQWAHLRSEEDELFPLARMHLTSDDWGVIEAAFSGHGDPLFGVEIRHEHEDLFRRIVSLAPQPLGRLGPPGNET